jgi:glycosyltransferase involved in cell wall biosynthesis
MNILFVVPYTPNPIRVRPYHLILALAQRGHHLTLATLWETPREQQDLAVLRERGVQVLAVALPGLQRVRNMPGALLKGQPLQAAYCHSPALLAQLEVTCRAQEFDAVHVEHLRGANYGLWLKQRLHGAGTPVIWDSVDCISYLFRQAAQYSQSVFGRMVSRLELGRTERYERWLCTQFERVLVTSTADMHAFELLAETHAPLSVVPNGVDLQHFAPSEPERQPNVIVYSGKMSYHANVTAALYLATQVMPQVWAERPGVKLVIAGSRPPAAITRLAADFPGRVEVTGYVADMAVPLRQAAIAAAPLLYGAGIQNKVLEAMACATPVVASVRATAALQVQPGVDCLVADTPHDFAGALLQLLGDAALRRQVGAAGRHYVTRHHDWDAIASQLETYYAQGRRSSANARQPEFASPLHR